MSMDEKAWHQSRERHVALMQWISNASPYIEVKETGHLLSMNDTSLCGIGSVSDFIKSGSYLDAKAAFKRRMIKR